MNWASFSRRTSAPPTARRGSAADGVTTSTSLLTWRSKTGAYRGLFDYLDKRYADTVVLTFQQIGDLLGAELPEAALTDEAWWSDTGSGMSDGFWSSAWTLANRTARPNLQARTVAFDRVP